MTQADASQSQTSLLDDEHPFAPTRIAVLEALDLEEPGDGDGDQQCVAAASRRALARALAAAGLATGDT